MKFFQPEVHNLVSDGRTSGYAVGECPLFYYFIAGLYKIFGQHDLIYRLVNTLLFFLGLFALYKMLEQWLGDSFWSMAVPVLLFTSPVVVYYANNYLTDTQDTIPQERAYLDGIWAPDCQSAIPE